MAKFRSQTELRTGWAEYLAQPEKMVWVDLGAGTRVQVNTGCSFIWEYFGLALKNSGYFMENKICYGYCNRQNTNNKANKSMHAYGIAVDINSTYNPNIHRNGTPRFSSSTNQSQRQKDVVAKVADTDFTPEIIESIRKLTTPNGYRVFSWGGDWGHVKVIDSMHFELACIPTDIATMTQIFQPGVRAPAVRPQGILV